MSGKSNTKWLSTMEYILGSRQAVTERMGEIGARGGRNGHKKGFATNHELAKEAGRKGGTKSRRGKESKGYFMRYNADGSKRFAVRYRGFHLGTFSTIAEARATYLKAVIKDRPRKRKLVV